MSNEIELKLLTTMEVVPVIQQQLLPGLDCQVNYSEKHLFNHYYDTRDKRLSDLRFGFRVRGCDGRFEQTIKTSGVVAGGLHSRPEFNIDLDNDQPDLTLFDQSIWPEGIDVSHMQSQLELQFTTHFKRYCWLLRFEQGDEVELVFDQGTVAADGLESDISELEMELVSGDVERLFWLAEKILSLCACRLGGMSKAARGYQLLRGEESPPYLPLEKLELRGEHNINQWFSQSLTYGLKQWQHHEQNYIEHGKLVSLVGTVESLCLIHQCLVLYAEVLLPEKLGTLVQELEDAVEWWQWLNSTQAMKTLRSSKGYYHKKLSRHPHLLSFLRGRVEGDLGVSKPETWFVQSSSLQLRLSRLLIEVNKLSDEPRDISAQFSLWLEKSWVAITTRLSQSPLPTIEWWLSQHELLKSTLMRGILLAGYYGGETAKNFRAPWQNLLDGVDELFVLHTLKLELERGELDPSGELTQWCESKVNTLLPLLEKSRVQVLAITPYWHESS